MDEQTVTPPAATTERLDRIYFCSKCKAVFLFESDTKDHDTMYGHAEFTTMPLK